MMGSFVTVLSQATNSQVTDGSICARTAYEALCARSGLWELIARGLNMRRGALFHDSSVRMLNSEVLPLHTNMTGAAAGGAERHLSGEGLRHAAAVAADQLLVGVHRHRVPLREFSQVLQLHAGRQLRPARRAAMPYFCGVGQAGCEQLSQDSLEIKWRTLWFQPAQIFKWPALE